MRAWRGAAATTPRGPEVLSGTPIAPGAPLTLDLAGRRSPRSCAATASAPPPPPGPAIPTSSLSAADLMAVLLSGHLHADWAARAALDNDRLIFSKGHASPLLYAMSRLRAPSPTRSCSRCASSAAGSRATPPPRCRGSTWRPARSGQGLPTAVGMALAAQVSTSCHTACWVLLGDSEMAEGSV